MCSYKHTHNSAVHTVDPLTSKYPHYTPYSFSGNKVISAIELEGLEEWEINKLDGSKAIIEGPFENNGAAQIEYDKTVDKNTIEPRDDYEKGILEGKITFNLNYGWVDETHAFTDTKRKHPYIGIANLWNQMLGEDKNNTEEFSVTYKQDIVKYGFSIGVQRTYIINPGLSIEEKRRITLAIVQDVTMRFETLQAIHPTSGSSFEPADLPSNMLSFYRTVFKDLNKTSIKKLIEPLSEVSSLSVYRQYTGTFTDRKYKNYDFAPKFFKTVYTPKAYSIPSELNSVTPMPYGGGFRFSGSAGIISFD